MADSFLVSVISFVFLMATISIELIAFLTTHMISSKFDANDHQGLFRRCGKLDNMWSSARCWWLNDFNLIGSGNYNSQDKTITLNSEERMMLIISSFDLSYSNF